MEVIKNGWECLDGTGDKCNCVEWSYNKFCKCNVYRVEEDD